MARKELDTRFEIGNPFPAATFRYEPMRGEAGINARKKEEKKRRD